MNSNIVNNGKQNLTVVVWEWKNKQGRWRPYIPEVTQLLERAHGKNLKSVMLGDAEPSLGDYYINLSSKLQNCKSSGQSVNVRRSLYPQNSPAGQGAVWQWAGDSSGDWHTYDMCVQCVIESAWMSGVQTIDMDETFPLCPYVINFCNLNQKNKKTGYTRSIRRKTQASYPIGRPVTPQHSSYSSNLIDLGPSASGISSRSTAPQESPPEPNKQKRRESREERESEVRPRNESHARHLLNKVLLLAGSSSCGGSEGSHCKGAIPKYDTNHAVSNGVPHPLPRSVASPPVPKPRTLFPCGQSRTTANPNFNQLQDQSSVDCEDYASTKSSHDDVNHQSADMTEEQYGSNVTLNSDCSSLTSVRRPSIETISTYLSQDSFNEELGASNNPQTHHTQSSDIRMDNLIQLNDSMSEDEVFSEDKEVQDVMMNINHIHHHQHNNKNNNPYLLEFSNPSQPESHFVPISTPVASDNPVINGVKRKRTNDRTHPHTAFNPPQHPVASKVETRSSKTRGESTTKDTSFGFRDTKLSYNNNTSSNFKKVFQRKPKTGKEKLLLQWTKPVVNPTKDDCPICMCPLGEDSSYGNNTGYIVSPVVSLSLCAHVFHEECLCQLLAVNSSIFLQCPNCKKLHGEKWGNQPPGNMRVQKISKSLPGYSGYGTVEITYSIRPGIQGPEHPNPGDSYNPIGFPRRAFLPDNDKGRRVLELLQEAFRRRLIFTVGTSVTTGIQNAVTWNEIHHKTEWFNNFGHGYPDSIYLDNVISELAAQGVV